METVLLPKNLRLPVKDILYLESISNYTNIITIKGRANHCIALSLCKVQALASDNLVRVNRGYVVNKDYVRHFVIEHNTLRLTLKNSKQFRTSRRRTQSVLHSLKTITQ